jgi:hypothetical protein
MSRLLVIASLVLLPLAGMAARQGKPLNDAALGPSQSAGVSAGKSDGIVKFQGSVPTAKWTCNWRRHTCSADWTDYRN